MLYSTCAHIAMFYSPCNESVHAEYNLSTGLCLTYNSLLTTYTQLPTTLQQGCVKLVIIQQSPHNLYTVTNNLTTRL